MSMGGQKHLPFFNDCAQGIAPDALQLIAYGRRLGIASREKGGNINRSCDSIALAESGYYILLAAKRTSKLFPSLCCFLNELNKCRDGSAHIAPPVNQFTEIRVARFSRR
jgi:hypothetical protein